MDPVVLFNYGRVDALLEPIRLSTRVKYTTLAVSSQHLALGANTGAVYCFDRRQLRLRRLLANKEGSISRLLFSPGGRLLALTVQKTLIVWDHNVDGRAKPRRVKIVIGDGKDGIITAISWDDRGIRLFTGDDRGNVKQMSIAKSKIESRIQMKDSDVIYRADSPVVQLDHRQGRLLVSTRTQCHIIELQPIKCSVTTVGSKPRDGVFGGCLNDALTIYTARPGSRIWEADVGGHVKSTHQLKGLLAVAPAVIWGTKSDGVEDGGRVWEPQSLSFHELHVIKKRHLLMWQPNGVYIFDPLSVQLIGWTNQFHDIFSLSCYEHEFFILHESAKSVSHLAVLSPQETAYLLFRHEKYSDCAQLILRYPDSIKPAESRRYMTLDMLSQLKEQLLALDLKEEAEKINAVLNESEDGSAMDVTLPKSYYRQSSGIFVVSKAPEAQTTRSLSIPASSGSLLKRYPSAPESLSFLATDADFTDSSVSLHSAISEESNATLDDATQFQFLDDRNESSKNLDVTDNIDVTSVTSLETNDDASGHMLESGPPSVCSSSSEQSYLTEEMVEKMKHETSPRPGSSIEDMPVGSIQEETEEKVLDEVLETRDERQTQEGDSEVRRVVETSSLQVKEVIEVPFPEVESADGQPRFRRLLSLVQREEDAGSSVPGNEDSIATSLRAVRRPVNKDKRKKKRKSIEGRKSVDMASLASSDQLETVSLDPRLLMPSVEADKSGTLSHSADHSDVSSSTPMVVTPPLLVASSPDASLVSLQSDANLVMPDALLGASESECGVMADRRDKPTLSDSGVVAGPVDDVGETCDDVGKEDETPLPPALTNLLDQTRQTQLSLQELEIIYSPDSLQSTLSEWTQLLHSHSTKHCSSPPPDSDNSQSIDTAVCDYWRNNMKMMSRLSRETLSLVATQAFEVCVCGTQQQDGESTSRAAEFIQQFLPILNVERVRQALVNSCSYTYDCWCVLSRDDPNANTTDAGRLIDHIRHSCVPDHRGHLLPSLSRLYHLDAQSAVHFCIELHPSVQPVEVAFLCGMLPKRQEEDASGCSRFELYLGYLNELTDSSSAVAARHHTLHQISRNQTLTELWFEAALKKSPPVDSLFTADKKPRISSHQIEWPEAPVLERILHSSLCRYSPKTLLRLCEQHGYWRGCVELMCRLGRRHCAVEVVVQLGDIQLVQCTQEWGDLPATVTEWEHLLSLMSSQHPPNTTESTLTWDRIAVTLIDKLGTAQCCRVLSQVELPPQCLPDGFMHLVYKCSTNEASQRSACRSLLEKYDSYLWSPKLSALSPHFQHLIDRERHRKQQKRDNFIGSSPLVVQKGEGTTHVLEDGACHWGVKVHLDRSDCPVSTLPLQEQASSGTGSSGLVVFDSGHVYHESYVPEQACISTFNKRFLSIENSTESV